MEAAAGGIGSVPSSRAAAHRATGSNGTGWAGPIVNGVVAAIAILLTCLETSANPASRALQPQAGVSRQRRPVAPRQDETWRPGVPCRRDRAPARASFPGTRSPS